MNERAVINTHSQSHWDLEEKHQNQTGGAGEESCDSPCFNLEGDLTHTVSRDFPPGLRPHISQVLPSVLGTPMVPFMEQP